MALQNMTVESLARVCRALSQAELDVEMAEERLAVAKEKERVLREELGPSMMQEIGVKELKLENGQKITMKQEVFVQMNSDEKEVAYRWLDENNFGGIIKTTVNVNFIRGELDRAKGLVSAMRSKGYDVFLKQDVHAQTMKALIKEQIAKGSDFPLDLFGAKPVWQLKIK